MATTRGSKIRGFDIVAPILIVNENRVSLRAATELFASRIDQLCHFINHHGLQPPPMNADDEAALARVLDTMQVPRHLDGGNQLNQGSTLSAATRTTNRPLAPATNIDNAEDADSDEEEDEAENNVLEQLSHRMGTLKIAGDGHLRYYGATSNLNLVDVSATQPRPRSVRHDGQDILDHLQIGKPVDQALEDHLVQLYFTWQNPSAYVVDKKMYVQARSTWRNEQIDTPYYSEVLSNAMYVFTGERHKKKKKKKRELTNFTYYRCAVGSAFDTYPRSLAEFFSDRAKALLEIELDSPCIATVQALIILSWHEGASNRDARGWLYSGKLQSWLCVLGMLIDCERNVNETCL